MFKLFILELSIGEIIKNVVYLLMFIIALRAVYFLAKKIDPLNALKIEKKHWIAEQIEHEKTQKTFDNLG